MHADEFCFAGDLGLPCQSGGNIGQRANANQRDTLVIGLHNGVTDCAHSIGQHSAGILV